MGFRRERKKQNLANASFLLELISYMRLMRSAFRDCFQVCP
jgi:hypothetical protein